MLGASSYTVQPAPCTFLQPAIDGKASPEPSSRSPRLRAHVAEDDVDAPAHSEVHLAELQGELLHGLRVPENPEVRALIGGPK